MQANPPPWLPLLRALSEATRSWGVWKNVDSALTGFSDVDSVAEPTEVDTIHRHFVEWSEANHLLAVIVCPHLPGSTLLVAPVLSGRLVELHVMHVAILRGAPLFEAEHLQPMMTSDERGFRKLRPGAEGMLLFWHNGVTKTGSPNSAGLERKGILGMIKDDPEGADAAARVFGAATDHAKHATSEAVQGRWSRRSVLTVQTFLLLRSLRTPSLLVSRVAFRLTGAARCPVLGALQSGRRVSDPHTWIDDVERSGHSILRAPREATDGSAPAQ